MSQAKRSEQVRLKPYTQRERGYRILYSLKGIYFKARLCQLVSLYNITLSISQSKYFYILNMYRLFTTIELLLLHS